MIREETFTQLRMDLTYTETVTPVADLQLSAMFQISVTTVMFTVTISRGDSVSQRQVFLHRRRRHLDSQFPTEGS